MNNPIGQTPLSKSAYLSSVYGCHIYIKEDFCNPGGSSKDRVALNMLESAERDGLISPGDTIVEASSGNTAIGLAQLCRFKGYKCKIFMSASGSTEKAAAIMDAGAEVVRCKTSGGPKDIHSSQYQAADYASTHPNTFFCNQYFNTANNEAHFNTTGPEIWRQSKGRITHFIAGVGTGGTICGVSKYLKSRSDQVQLVGVDPVGSMLSHYFKYKNLDHYQPAPYKIEGIGRNFLPGTLDFSLIDQFCEVSGFESTMAAYEFRAQTGFAPGFSSGAVLAALDHLELKPSDHVVLFFADQGDRYCSKLYNTDWLFENIMNDQEQEIFSHTYGAKIATYV